MVRVNRTPGPAIRPMFSWNFSARAVVSGFMRSLCAVAGAALVACNLAGLAETRFPCHQSLNAPMASRTNLSIDSRPGGLHITGSDDEKIHVTCTTQDSEQARHVHLDFSGNAGHARLSITGTAEHDSNLEVQIEVPHRTNLYVRMSAGEVKVEEVKGDKDIDLYAGQITISSNHEWNYQNVDASVDIGEVKAQAYDADRGGFFRRFTKTNPNGEYNLHAHVMTGEVDLVGKQKPQGAGTSD